MGDVFLWEKTVSPCWKRKCLLVGEEHVSFWRRTCLLVGEDYHVFFWLPCRGDGRFAPGSWGLVEGIFEGLFKDIYQRNKNDEKM